MDREQFLEQLAAPAGGKENIGLCDFRSGCLSVTVKDRSVIDLNAIRGLPGVADAELLRSRLRITLDQTIMEELQMAKKEDYGALAKQILSLVGGAENVSNATHCATRLRFNLKDESKADTDAIKGLPGRLIPVPRELTADCGMSWRAEVQDRAALAALTEAEGLEADGFYELVI